MTVQAGIEVETDLEVLVGEMPAIPCENSGHGTNAVHPAGGEATHMFRGKCPACKEVGELQAVCAALVKSIRKPNVKGRCDACGHRDTGLKFIETLEPIR